MSGIQNNDSNPYFSNNDHNNNNNSYDSGPPVIFMSDDDSLNRYHNIDMNHNHSIYHQNIHHIDNNSRFIS